MLLDAPRLNSGALGGPQRLSYPYGCMAIAKPQLQFIVASVVEFIGILALATRFGADRGGVALLVVGAALVLAGLGWQIRALVRAQSQASASKVSHDV